MSNILFSILYLVLLPGLFLFTLWRGKFKAKFIWLLDAFASALIIIWLFHIGNWSWFSYYLRYLWIVILIYVLIVSYLKVKHLPFMKKLTRSEYMTIGLYALLIIVFGFYNFQVAKTYTFDEQAVELDFPLKDGTYIIIQGGNGTMMNYHSAYESQKFALDILKINALGMRARGVYPKNNEKYEIYSDTIYSPCDGTVKASENNLENLTPPNSDPEHPEGNFVALQCDGVDADILLAHMQKGSVQVNAEDTITKGQPLGKIGNTGNTSEPHLHIHAEKDGQGIPITFNQRFLVRNQTIK